MKNGTRFESTLDAGPREAKMDSITDANWRSSGLGSGVVLGWGSREGRGKEGEAVGSGARGGGGRLFILAGGGCPRPAQSVKIIPGAH